MTHIRIDLAKPDDHGKHVSMYDKITVVPDEGNPIDISHLVKTHRLESTCGSARMLHLELFAAVDIEATALTTTGPDGSQLTYRSGRWHPER